MHGQPSHPRSLHQGVDYLLMIFVNWKLARTKRTDILNQSDPDLLRASQSCQYREKENTKDRPRGGCITAATASLFRSDSSSQPLSLSLLYKRTIVREKKVSFIEWKVWFLVTVLPLCSCFPCASPTFLLLRFYLPFPFSLHSVCFQTLQVRRNTRMIRISWCNPTASLLLLSR